MEMNMSIHTEIMTSMSSVEVMAWADIPPLQTKQIWGGEPFPEKWRRRGRRFTATQLITSCRCVPGCLNISVSPPCVKHDADKSKSQTIFSRKNKRDIFLPLKANSEPPYLKIDCICETTGIQREESLMFAPLGNEMAFCNLYENILLCLQT